MHLIWATKDYKLSGRSVPGMPIILWDSMESCVPVNNFLRSHLSRAAIESDYSWKAAGQSLYDYFSFLQAHNLDWRDVDRGESKTLISAYRGYCRDEHSHARNTLRLRIYYISEFYKFAFKHGLIRELPINLEIRHRRSKDSLLMHLDARGSLTEANGEIPRKHKALPKYLTRDQVKALINIANNVHHRMIVSFAVRSGLRRMELATFPVMYVKQALHSSEGRNNISIRLDPSDGSGMKTKRGKARDILMSRKLLLQLDRYITQHRGLRTPIGTPDSARLFLNQNGKPYSNEGKGLEKIVRDLGKKIGLDVYPHMLRHSYATHTLASLQRLQSNQDPLIFLSRQLGHSSITTTEIYLHLVDDYVDNAVLEYDDELNELGTSDG
ncbi:tyrosine-type recombinase/integrase [Pseudomonas sp. CJQ_11]|uniref:tyrosine-type recombinase/integrase n=1 Tax=Pseudomonas sp. CJQ_11 TaxID=3367169 RepID=UPI00370C04EB